MRVSKFLIIFIIFSLAFVLAGTSFAAGGEPPEPPDWSDPELVATLSATIAQADNEERLRLWKQLSPEAQDAVIKYNTVVRVESEDLEYLEIKDASAFFSGEKNLGEKVLGPGGCKTRYKAEKAYNYFGNLLWKYWSKVEWCYNGFHGSGSQVTSKFWTHGAQIPFPSLWRWTRDAAGPVESGGVGKTFYRVWIMGEMRVDIAGYPILVSYPWVDITVRGDGSSSASSGQ